MQTEIVAKIHAIPENTQLLHTMVADSAAQPPIYKPGKYWAAKSKNAVKEIEKFGLGDFRGSSNSVGTSFADNLYYDSRTLLSFGLRRPLKFALKRLFPLNTVFNAQVKLTLRYAEELIAMRAYVCSSSTRIDYLLDRYKMPYSIAGGCVDFFERQGVPISHFYVTLLDIHDHVAREVDFTKARSFFEIGGGFGGNVHLLLENYPNLKKFVYLDIPPNLYVGTQYLKSFYGDSVRDYLSTRDLKEITFQNNDELEIICIAPWQIERLNLSVDLFYNSRSFVEMTPEIIRNYAKHIENLPNSYKTKMVLVSYGLHNLEKSLHPDLLQSYFNRSFEGLERRVLPYGDEQTFIYISAGLK